MVAEFLQEQTVNLYQKSRDLECETFNRKETKEHVPKCCDGCAAVVFVVYCNRTVLNTLFNFRLIHTGTWVYDFSYNEKRGNLVRAPILDRGDAVHERLGEFWLVLDTVSL